MHMTKIPPWGWSIAAGALAFLILVILGWSLKGADASNLALMVLGGLVVLILMLAGLVTIMHTLGLSDSKQAFGLPDGTIRALLALSLLVVFVGLSTFLFGNFSSPQTTGVLRLVNEMPVVAPDDLENIISSIPTDFIVLQLPNPDETSFNVQVFTRELVSNQARENLASQIFTAISTVLVTVIGFYFGSRTTAAAEERGRTAPEAKPTPAERASVAANAAEKSAAEAALDLNRADQAAKAARSAADMAGATSTKQEQANTAEQAARDAKTANDEVVQAAKEARDRAQEAAAASDEAAKEKAASDAEQAQAKAKGAAGRAKERADVAEKAKQEAEKS